MCASIRLLAVAVVLLGLTSANVVHAAAPAPHPLIALPSSFVELYEKIFAAPSDQRPGRAESAAYGDLALRLYQDTHDPHYRDEAVRLIDQTVTDPAGMADFHVLHHLGEFAWRMKREGLLKPVTRQALAKFARQQFDVFLKSKDDGDYNIRIGTIAGYLGLLKFMDGETLEDREAVRQKIDAYWELIRRTGDLDEDASNYDSLGCAFVVDLVRLMGREQDLKTPHFRRMFDRFRDIVSPAALIPEYGDAYFSYDGMPMDRIYLLEFAAKLYDDPTYLYASRKLYARPQSGLPDLDHWTRSLALLDMDLLNAAPKEPTGNPSMVTYRARRDFQGDLVDKLILRTGLQPGNAMVLMDLYASGSHAHPNKGPSIAYFEADQVPLFHNMGRHHTRSAIAGNVFWAMPADAGRFPGCWDRDNEWFTMRIPAAMLTHNGDQVALPPALTLRNFKDWSRGCTSLWFDNLRLTGPGGVKLIDDFDSDHGWGPRLGQITKIETDTSDHTQGAASQKIAWAPVPSDSFSRRFPTAPSPVPESEYDELKLDLKYTGARPMMHLRGLGEQMDLGDQIMQVSPPTATAEQHGGDACGRVQYARYLRDDSKLTRTIVLTREGVLVVHDVLTPGPSMEGWNAGTLWQLYQLAASGDGWFCAEDDGIYPAATINAAAPGPRQMLVRFAPEPQTTDQIETVKQPYYDPNPRQRKPAQFSTTFSQREIHAGQQLGLTYVVLAHDPAAGSPQEAAESIRFAPVVDAEHAQVTLTSPSGPPTVVTIQSGAWEVQREKR